MRFVMVMCILISAAYVLHSMPDDVYFLNLAIYTLLFALLLQIAGIYRRLEGE